MFFFFNQHNTCNCTALNARIGLYVSWRNWNKCHKSLHPVIMTDSVMEFEGKSFHSWQILSWSRFATRSLNWRNLTFFVNGTN